MGAGKQPKQQKPLQNQLSAQQQVPFQCYQGTQPFPGAPQQQPFPSGPQYPMPPPQYQQPQQQTLQQFPPLPIQHQHFFGPPPSNNPQYFQGPPPQPFCFQNGPGR